MDRFLRAMVYVVLAAMTVWSLFGCRSVGDDTSGTAAARRTRIVERSPAWSGRTGI